jgi:hypothetical protein
MTDDEKAPGSNSILAPLADNSIPYASRKNPQIAKARLTNFQTFLVAFLSTVVALLLASSVALSHPPLERDNGQSSGSSGITYCAGVKTTEKAIIYCAIGEMRRTKEGNHLANEILAKPLCFGVEELIYNGGYFSVTRGTEVSDGNRIVIDRTELKSLTDEELGAILVHEATHAHRAFAGMECSQTHDCAYLPNEIAIDEEVAAHSAEARFWIEIKEQDDSKGGASSSDFLGTAYYDELAAAYKEGPEAFRAYVIELRSDPREGHGI